MKRIGLCVLCLALAFAVTAALSSAQSAPEFKLGFKTLADQLTADVVGTPTENEYFNLANGNSEQHMTKGLMVWRKIDNWTAYTNGYMTWINGPIGVQSRLNAERFAWERDPVVPGTVTPAPTIPQVLAYWSLNGELVAQDLASGATRLVQPPEPGVRDFAISADLSTYAWVPSSGSWRLMTKRVGQPAKILITLDDLLRVSETGTSPFVSPLDPRPNAWDNYLSLSLSERGTLVSVSPLWFSAGRMGGTAVLNVENGVLVTASHQARASTSWMKGGRISPDETLIVGTGLNPPGASGYPLNLEALAGAATATVQSLEASIQQAAGQDGTPYNMTLHEPSWRGDSRAVAYVQTRRNLDPLGQCSSTDSIVLAAVGGFNVLYSRPAVDLGHTDASDPSYCNRQQEGSALSNPALSVDGGNLAFQQDEYSAGRVTRSSILISNVNTGSLRRIGDGKGPFWVVQRSTPPTTAPRATPVLPAADKGMVVLTVRTADSRPCQGKAVELIEERDRQRYTAVLDENGRAVIGDVVPGGYTWTETGCMFSASSDPLRNIRVYAGQTTTTQLEWDTSPNARLRLRLDPPSGFPQGASRIYFEVEGIAWFYPTISGDGSVVIEQRPGRVVRLIGFYIPTNAPGGSPPIPARFEPVVFGPLEAGSDTTVVVRWTSAP